MRTRRTLVLSVDALIVFLQIPGTISAQDRAQADADVREVTAYRLTMESVNKAAAAMRLVAAELKKDPRYQELATVKAELEALRKKDELTESEEARIEQLTAREEQLESTLDNKGLAKSDTLSDMEASLKAEPVFAGALAKAGIPPREFAKFLLAMFQASFAAGLQKAGTIKELPKEVNAENVKFVLEHEAELKTLQEEMKALGGDQ